MYPDVLWIWNGFQFLSETRDYSFGGPLRIKPSEITHHLDLEIVDDLTERRLFYRCINQIDNIWMNDYYERQEKKTAEEEKLRKFGR